MNGPPPRSRPSGSKNAAGVAVRLAELLLAALAIAYDGAANRIQMNSRRVGSFVLLGGGVVLVFAGVSSALGFSLPGMIASAAAILALLYAGGVWFGGAAGGDASVLLFTHVLTVAAGPLAGRQVIDLFPAESRSRIEDGCRRAMAGEASRFSCGAGQAFAVSPVRSAEGVVVYGLLLSGAAAQAESSAVMPAV